MHQADYKQKYRNLKQNLKFLVYEQECFLDQLRKSQKELLRVSRDKSFLMDRLLMHLKVEESSDDSQPTDSSDSDIEVTVPKRKKITVSRASHLTGVQGSTRKQIKPASKRPKTVKIIKSGQSVTPSHSHLPGQMTRQELEHHLATKATYSGIEVPPNKLPTDIFSDNSNHQSDEADEDLVIDVP